MNKKVTITGDLGSGKSSVAQLLAEAWDLEKYSVGAIQRLLARKYRMSTLELNRYADENPDVDKEIDSIFTSLAASREDFIVDARLGWHFLPDSFKIKLTVDTAVGAERVMRDQTRISEGYRDKTQAIEQIQARKKSEAARFKKCYGVDLNADDNFNVIIDTTLSSLDEIRDIIINLGNKYWKKEPFQKHWVSPLRLFPLENIWDNEDERRISSSIQQNGFDSQFPVTAIQIGDKYFIFDGHKRVSGAIFNEVSFIPVLLIPQDCQDVVAGISAIDYVKDSFSLSKVYDWEDAHKFTFYDYPQDLESLENEREKKTHNGQTIKETSLVTCVLRKNGGRDLEK